MKRHTGLAWFSVNKQRQRKVEFSLQQYYYLFVKRASDSTGDSVLKKSKCNKLRQDNGPLP